MHNGNTKRIGTVIEKETEAILKAMMAENFHQLNVRHPIRFRKLREYQAG